MIYEGLRPVEGVSSISAPCQNCGSASTVHLTRIIEGEKKHFHFCQNCVDKQKLLKNQVLQVGQVLQAILGPMPLATLKCPACQIQFMEFRSIGRLGCPHDYNSLKTGLVPIIKKVQRKFSHLGKRPKRIHVDQDWMKKIIGLRVQLQGAVEAEDFSTAISLRDAIKAMEAEKRGRSTDEHG